MCWGQVRVLCFPVLVGSLKWFLQCLIQLEWISSFLLLSGNEIISHGRSGKTTWNKATFYCPESVSAAEDVDNEDHNDGGPYTKDMSRLREEALRWGLGIILTTDEVKCTSTLVNPTPHHCSWLTRRWMESSLGSFHEVASQVAWWEGISALSGLWLSVLAKINPDCPWKVSIPELLLLSSCLSFQSWFLEQVVGLISGL